MPQAAPTDLTRRLPGVKHGSVRSYAIKTWNLVVGKARQVHLYQPAASEPCPLLVVWDGKEYLRRAKLPLIVDNLIHQGRIRPVALAMIENSQAGRAVEYSCSESTLVFLSDLVLPIARQELNLIDNTSQPGAYAVMGASMGGLIALYTGLRLPDIFGHVISQSGAFVLDRHEMVVFDLVSQTPPGDLNIWMDIGIYDIRDIAESKPANGSIVIQPGLSGNLPGVSRRA